MLNQKAVLPFFRFGTPTESLDAPCRNEKLAGAKVFNTPVIALVVAFGYYLGSQIGFLLTPASTPIATFWQQRNAARRALDRKSTRLNSSHSQISYAVFCLKKKNTTFLL